MTRTFDEQVAALEKDWAENPRWKGVTRDYTAADVVRLRGSVTPEYTMARNGAEKLWQQINDMDYVHALGTMTGGQAIQYAKAGLPAIYLSAGKSPATPTSPVRSTPTSRCTPPTPSRRSWPASTTPCVVPTRSSGARPTATPRSTTCCRSSPTPKPASVARSTPTNS